MTSREWALLGIPRCSILNSWLNKSHGFSCILIQEPGQLVSLVKLFMHMVSPCSPVCLHSQSLILSVCRGPTRHAVLSVSEDLFLLPVPTLTPPQRKLGIFCHHPRWQWCTLCTTCACVHACVHAPIQVIFYLDCLICIPTSHIQCFGAVC